MRVVIGIDLVLLPLLGHASSHGRLALAGSTRGEEFTKGTYGEPAVLPGVLTVIRRPMGKHIGPCAKGAFAVDNSTKGTCQIEANAPGLYAGLAVMVKADTSSIVPLEMGARAGSSTTSPQSTRLKATDCAFSRRVHHHA
jgi:hypothetical protein